MAVTEAALREKTHLEIRRIAEDEAQNGECGVMVLDGRLSEEQTQRIIQAHPDTPAILLNWEPATMVLISKRENILNSDRLAKVVELLALPVNPALTGENVS